MTHHYEHKKLDLSFDHVRQNGKFNGYASLFNVADLANDIVEKGAFSQSLRDRYGRAVRMLFQHDPNQPIGHWTRLVEDHKGLYVEGQLTLDVAKARDIHALMLVGALDGLSIGFKTLKSRKDPQTGARHILSADLWEISVVTFPLLPSARIEHVKCAAPKGAGFEQQLATQIRQAALRL